MDDDVTLSSAELRRLAELFTAAVSPLCYSSLDEWRGTVRDQLGALLHADRSVSQLHVEGEPELEAPVGVEPAIIAYAAYYHALDTGLSDRRRALGLEVVPLRAIYDLDTLPRTELFNDWTAPSHFYDALAVAVDVPPAAGPAGFWFYHERPDSPPFGARGEALLQLLLPAIKAGLQSVHQMALHRHQLCTALDQLPHAIMLADGAGRVLHENPRLLDLMRSEPEGARLRAELSRMAQCVGAVVQPSRGIKSGRDPLNEPPTRELRTGRGRFRLTATWLGEGHVTPHGCVLAMLEAVATPALDAHGLRTRYGLTTREIDVLRLVRAGDPVPRIAETLRISRHTARHHVEALRTKLGVHRVGEIANVLREV